MIYCQWICNSGPTFWKSTFKQQLGFRFDIMDSISSICFVFWHMQFYVLIHQIIFRLYLYFLNNLLHFFSSTPVLTFSIDVVLILFLLSVMVGTNLPYRIPSELLDECQADGISVYRSTMRSWPAGNLEIYRCSSILNCAYLSPFVLYSS